MGHRVSAKIEICPHDPLWPTAFEREKAAVLAACGAILLAVHHVGSTSIPGLAAKPVIDMLAVLDRHDDGLACVAPLLSLGYEYRGANGLAGRHYFSKGRPHSHHLHMLAQGHPEIARLIGFRDHLRANPAEAAAYEALKRDLALQYGEDRRCYTDAKSAFCKRIMRTAGLA